jgi:hypothetical protein
MNGLTSLRSTAKLTAGLMRWHLLMLLVAFGVTSCAPNAPPITETQYSAKLAGDWQGTVGDIKETISFRADGGFTSQVRPTGFISNTLGQGVTGTIRGTWAIQGKVITLTINSAENERLQNKTTSSTIESFKQNALVVKSASGETSTFVRVL